MKSEFVDPDAGKCRYCGDILESPDVSVCENCEMVAGRLAELPVDKMSAIVAYATRIKEMVRA